LKKEVIENPSAQEGKGRMWRDSMFGKEG